MAEAIKILTEAIKVLTQVVTIVTSIVIATCTFTNLQPKKLEVSSPQPLSEVTITNIITIDATEDVQIDNRVNSVD